MKRFKFDRRERAEEAPPVTIATSHQLSVKPASSTKRRPGRKLLAMGDARLRRYMTPLRAYGAKKVR